MIRPFRFLSKHEIECRALDVLTAMGLTVQDFPLDSSVVAEFLGLDVVWDVIPDDGRGLIAARILPLERLIEMNEALPSLQGGMGESTLAHEIGHWVLHLDQGAIARAERLAQRGLHLKIAPFLCRNATEAEGIEWQAQYFATCLLMPRFVMEARSHPQDVQDWRSLYQFADDMGVTISNLIHRLKDLGWITDVPESTQTPILKQS
ncbi:ImmA/IrrE family metallo-endopeptidase [Spirulina major CS-329]|jgi:hypothetical protein|uniref:ImmA/IrrE family metallo-endopeptidase n=1 Tax=Spirulina TaxID=1154 RepID=UPI0023308D47|nr:MULTISPECIES: ImmA/IrrE family metallo-endopeptidase [Spirulina]MDB9494496.1 ImmA/IrrE family metallo-endopeptidase [Spirulina subsalsa CS-330]MDB9502787.1 ImmA/IrrE family metallo-endopeptidase [Spirulina major CS-329]